ncbi:MAG: M28 family peptidase [Burkholderiaceae bacterium]
MRRLFTALAASVLTCVAHAQDMPLRAPLPAFETSRSQQIVAQVDAAELRATITKLVSFGTRHTASDTKSDTRGIGAARRWAASRFAAIARDCGGCLTVVTPSQSFTGPRLPRPTEVMDIVAIQRGTDDPDRVVLIAGHLDSRVTDIMNATSDAPGANDDASGVAAAIESARVLSKYKFRATIVYAALSGEEQGLYGGKVLADYARANGWRIEADLNNDIIGNSNGEDGVHDNSTVRVFSEGTKATETQKQANTRRYQGGEIDSPSRNLARYLARIAERDLVNFKVKMVYRTDRFGRGGDQVPILEAGYPAVRVTEAHEHYDRQHQDLRVENGVRYGDTVDGVDFDYLAQVTCLNALGLANMAAAPAPPSGVKIEGAVKHDTTISWQPVAGAVGYRVWWRDTTAAQWQHHVDVRADATNPNRTVLKNLVIDDWAFGVSSISADGFESPITYPGDAGAYFTASERAAP